MRRGDLKFDIDREYVTIGGVGDWDWNIGGPRGGNAYLNVAPWLGKSLRENSAAAGVRGAGLLRLRHAVLRRGISA